jgi:hypothetical protein
MEDSRRSHHSARDLCTQECRAAIFSGSAAVIVGADKTVTEWNVGCERCHGPGSDHTPRPTAVSIRNPARFDYVSASDTCIQCHSQGQPLTNPISGKYYDWPVGFEVGRDLNKFWKLEEHKLGETTFTHPNACNVCHTNKTTGRRLCNPRMRSGPIKKPMMRGREIRDEGAAIFSCGPIARLVGRASEDSCGPGVDGRRFSRPRPQGFYSTSGACSVSPSRRPSCFSCFTLLYIPA